MIPSYGYCAVTADFLHIGHKRFIEECSKRCGWLIVGIMTDECVEKYKGRRPIMNAFERAELVQSLKGVRKTVFQDTYAFPEFIVRLKKKYGIDLVIFDVEEHNREHADVILPKTPGISSTIYRESLTK